MPPSEIASRMAITRPRMACSVDNCTRLTPVVSTVCAAIPTPTSTRPNAAGPGISAAATMPAPKQAEPATSRPEVGLSRRADKAAPSTEPTAMADASMP